MSFETIRIVRQYPVVNGFVQLPHNLEKNKSATTLADMLALGATLNGFGPTGGARLAGMKHGTQEWVEFGEQVVVCCEIDNTPPTVEDAKDRVPDNSTRPPDDGYPPGDNHYNDPPCECGDLPIGDCYNLYISGEISGDCCSGYTLPGGAYTLYQTGNDGPRVVLNDTNRCYWTTSASGFTIIAQLVQTRCGDTPQYSYPRSLAIFNDQPGYTPYDNGGCCYWLIMIICDLTGEVVWAGTMDTGSTPIGTYTALPGYCANGTISVVLISGLCDEPTPAGGECSCPSDPEFQFFFSGSVPIQCECSDPLQGPNTAIISKERDTCTWSGYYGNNLFTVGLVNEGDQCYWIASVTCYDNNQGLIEVWRGYLAGSSPIGSYTAYEGYCASDTLTDMYVSGFAMAVPETVAPKTVAPSQNKAAIMPKLTISMLSQSGPTNGKFTLELEATAPNPIGTIEWRVNGEVQADNDASITLELPENRYEIEASANGMHGKITIEIDTEIRVEESGKIILL